MIPWKPDLQPRIDTDDRTWREWLVRNVERLSRWTSTHLSTLDPHPQYAMEGYGGITLSTPNTTVLSDLTTTPIIIPGAAYDSLLAPEPIDVVQDLANGRITVQATGIWLFTLAVWGNIIPITSNDSNTIHLSVYNHTDSELGNQNAFFTVPRYGESFFMAITLPVLVVESAMNKEFALAIWQRQFTPQITIEELTSVELHATRIAKPG